MTRTSTQRKHEANLRAFNSWPHPAGTKVTVRRPGGENLWTVTTSPSFMLGTGSYVTVEGISSNVSLRRILLRK